MCIIFHPKIFLIIIFLLFYNNLKKYSIINKKNIISNGSMNNNLTINNINPIKVAYYCHANIFGGIARVISLLINYLSKEKYFIHYLINDVRVLKNEYPLPSTTKRIILSEKNKTLFDVIESEKIDILIYNFMDKDVIERLNRLNNLKIIYYDHSIFLAWIYENIYDFKKTVYDSYKNCNYVLSLIPLENNYLFKKWGINSILIQNLVTYEYNLIKPSNLIMKNIIMLGRAYASIKRYDLGIKAMQLIIKEIPESKMFIISSSYNKLNKLIKNLNLEKNVLFSGYQKNPENYLKNASLHILCSLFESYSLALAETKIFGIPSILCGLDYLILAKGGTVIIYDDNPITLAEEAIKILKNYTYRKILGTEARRSMKKYKNEIIIKKWVKLLLSVYKNDDEGYHQLVLENNKEKITEYEAEKILSNQLDLLKKRNPTFKNISLEKLKYFSLT